MRRQKIQARVPFFVPPAQPMEVPIQLVPVTLPVTLQELKRRTVGLELGIPTSYKDDSWPDRRNAWHADVHAARSPQEVAISSASWSITRPGRRLGPVARCWPSWLAECGATTADDVEFLRQDFADSLVF